MFKTELRWLFSRLAPTAIGFCGCTKACVATADKVKEGAVNLFLSTLCLELQEDLQTQVLVFEAFAANSANIAVCNRG